MKTILSLLLITATFIFGTQTAKAQYDDPSNLTYYSDQMEAMKIFSGKPEEVEKKTNIWLKESKGKILIMSQSAPVALGDNIVVSFTYRNIPVSEASKKPVEKVYEEPKKNQI